MNKWKNLFASTQRHSEGDPAGSDKRPVTKEGGEEALHAEKSLPLIG